MPVPRDNERIAKLRQASTHLRAGGPARPDLADEVDFLLTEEGARFLNRMRWGTVAEQSPNLAISMSPELRARLKALASENGKKLDQILREGFDRYIAGEWLPPEPVTRRRGGEKVNLNLRTDAGQRQRLRELKPARSEELGFQVPDAWIALAWLLEEFGLEPGDVL